jgi:hypothetical protein
MQFAILATAKNYGIQFSYLKSIGFQDFPSAVTGIYKNDGLSKALQKEVK